MVLGPDMFSRHYFPSAMTAKVLSGINLAPILDVNRLIGGSVKISVCIYATVMGIKQVFNLKDYKVLVLPVVAFMVTLSIWLYDSVFQTVSWSEKYYFIYAFPFQFIFPTIILLVSLWKKR
jgi:spore germination protein KB